MFISLLGCNFEADMAKGKKRGPKTKDVVEQNVTSEKETKENKPSTNKESMGKVQSYFQSARSPSKPRSPLSDSLSVVIQEGNECDAVVSDSPKLNKDVPPGEIKSESSASEGQKPETPCQSNGKGEQLADTPEQNKSDAKTQTKPAADGKVSTSKAQSKPARKPGSKQAETKVSQNRKVTDYYPIRRSNRKTKSDLKNEEHKLIDDIIRSGVEDGMQVKHIEGKGRGVFAVHGFKKGDFVVEYHGTLLELSEAKAREAQYAQDPQTGCYMYYFQYKSKTYCVDATLETERLGRLINHSKSGNCQTKLHPIDGSPHLILVASRDIAAEEELLYDYGDRSSAAVSAHPWLKH